MKRLNVYMNGLWVGILTMTNDGAHHFEYVDSWLSSSGARPISLSMPLRKKAYTGNVVYNFFDNLLPDSSEIRQRIVARYQADSTQPFDLLSKIGRDIVGALQLLPEGIVPIDVHTIEYDILDNKTLEQILLGYQSKIPLGMITELQDFRISVAGAQEKTALLKMDGNWCIPKGATPTTHIIKLPIGKIETHSYALDLTESVENEYLCLMIAREYGLPVPDCEILTLENIKGLAVRRFDRQFSSNGQWIMRIPQEDFCQVLNISPALKYENQGGPGIADIMQYLEGSIVPKRDRAIFMRAQVLFWLLAATDGHAKNFSLFIRTDGLFELTPLYDIISLYPVMGGRGIHIRDAKLAMSLRGSKGKKYNIHTIFPRHFEHTAALVGFSQSEMRDIMHEFALKTPEVVAAIQAKLPVSFSQHIKTTILNGLLARANRLQQL